MKLSSIPAIHTPPLPAGTSQAGPLRSLAAPLLATIAMAIGVPQAEAALSSYDGFGYTAGALAGNAGGSGWSGTWTGDHALIDGSLAYGPLATSGNRVSLTGSQAFRNLGSTMGGAGTETWISFLGVITGSDIGISLFEGGAEKNFMGTSGGIGGNWGHVIGANLDTGVAGSTEPHFYVLQISTPATGDATVNLWLDPDQSSLGSGSAPTGGIARSGTVAPYSFDRVRLGKFGGGSTNEVDEFRLGTTWADVSPVPEPSTVGLLAIGVLALARRRRC